MQRHVPRPLNIKVLVPPPFPIYLYVFVHAATTCSSELESQVASQRRLVLMFISWNALSTSDRLDPIYEGMSLHFAPFTSLSDLFIQGGLLAISLVSSLPFNLSFSWHIKKQNSTCCTVPFPSNHTQFWPSLSEKQLKCFSRSPPASDSWLL